MQTNDVARRAGTQPIRYRIVVRAELESGSVGLEGWSVRSEDGYCVLTGHIVDQSQLMGIIEWLGDRGVELVSLAPVQSSQAPPGDG